MRLIFTALSTCLTLLPANLYRVQLTPADGGRIIEIDPEQYVAGVVAGESGTFKSFEALQAMAVAARTFAASARSPHKAQGFDFCSTTHCQRFLPAFHDDRALNAVHSTQHQLLYWHNQPALTPYSQDCGGLAEADPNTPYLRVHPDPYCTRNGTHQWSWDPTRNQLEAALKEASIPIPKPLIDVRIERQTPGHRAEILELISPSKVTRINAAEFRLIIGRAAGWNLLHSDYYRVQSESGRIHFNGKGRGHGIGLCQLGADEMGREGQTYRQILAFYYPGTSLHAQPGQPVPAIPWLRLGGLNVAVFLTSPTQDAKVLRSAEQMLRAIKERLQIDKLPEVSIYIYPNMESFRSNTEEPGWVAAHTSGTRIDMQPVRILESRGVLIETLHHELLHVAVNSQSADRVPPWFREGLVEYLDHQSSATATAEPSDRDLRQRHSETAARRAYANAEQKVATLAVRYGEPALLSWLRQGLPAEVTASNDNKAPAKSR